MCKYCDELIGCAYALKNIGGTMSLYDKVLIFNKDNEIKFWYSESKEKAPYELHRCPICKVDLQHKLQQASVSEKPNKSTDKKLGDYTLREISQVCEKLKAKYNCGACEYCPFNREFELEEGIIYECMLDYFDCLEDEEDRDEFLNKKLVDIYNVLK